MYILRCLLMGLDTIYFFSGIILIQDEIYTRDRTDRFFKFFFSFVSHRV